MRNSKTKTTATAPAAAAPLQEKGLAVALNMVGKATLREIWSLVGDVCENNYIDELGVSIDEMKYQADKAKGARAIKLFENSLSPEQRVLYTNFDNARCTQTYWGEIVGFYLGYATAVRFGADALAAAPPPAAAPAEPSPTDKAELEFAAPPVAVAEAPITALSVDEVIEIIIHDVDRHIPAAMHKIRPMMGSDHQGSDVFGAFFDSSEAREIESRIDKLLDRWPEEDNSLLLYDWLPYRQGQVAACAYCAGLRAAGISKETTRRMMLGFLRNYVS